MSAPQPPRGPFPDAGLVYLAACVLVCIAVLAALGQF